MASGAVSGGRLRWLRRVLALTLLLLLVLGLWTGWALLASRGDLDRARDAATAAQEDGTLDQTRARLATARADLARADGRLSAPGPSLTARLPLLGRTPQAARSATKAALAAVVSGQRVLDATTTGPPLVDDGRIDPAGLQRVAAALRRSARDVAAPVARLRSLETGLTPPPVRRGVEDARDELGDLPRRLTNGADALDALAGVTGRDGPRRLLLVLENNAELRGAGGLVTVFAEASTQDGRISLQPFRDVEDVADPAARARRVPAPPDYERLWGPYLANSTLWKNTNMSPDVPTSSAVLAEVGAATLGRRPDAVVWLDVRALAAVIGATSPAVLADGTRLTKRSTVDALLSGAYRGAVDSRAGQAARRARLREAADAVADRLLRGRPDAARLSLALATSAAGRHLAVWSAVPTEQTALVRASLAGAAAADGGDLTSFAVQNFGGGDRDGNKLDYYARRQVKVRVRLTRTAAEVEQEIVLRNGAPLSGLPVYVAGRATPGTSNNFVTVAVPKGAQLRSFTRGGQDVRTELLPEGDHSVLTDALSLPAGTATSWLLRYRLPLDEGRYVLRLLPQPLAIDARLRVDITADSGLVLRDPSGREGPVSLTQDFEEQLTLEVRAEKGSLLRRFGGAVRRFWNEPVELPF